jgi:hypothetical protein
MKKVFFHGILAGLLATSCAMMYNQIYSEALLVDFSKIINAISIAGATFFACLLASLAYYFFSQKIKRNADLWFNIIFLLITFASFLSPFSISLPFEIESPELFIGLSIPLHLFPVLFWLATKPLFWKVSN